MKHKSKRNKYDAGGRKTKRVDEKDVYVDRPVEHDEVDDERRDLNGMNQWIQSLNYESLVEALEITFYQTNAMKDVSRQRSNNLHNHRLVEDSGSHEFDLLIAMSSYQTPDKGLDFNGFRQLEFCHEWRQYINARLDVPTLFRWISDDHDDTKESSDEAKTRLVEDGNNLSSMGAISIPSELLDVLALAGVKRSTSALLETFNEVDEIDKEFESLADCQSNMTKTNLPPMSTFFTLESYHGVTDDGLVLGRGSTVEQQTADRSILLWTVLVRDKSLSLDETPILPTCRLRCDDASKNEQQRKKSILHSLHVSSRGKFLTNSGKQSQRYQAPWFDPTEQWFTLPMYLASRFEASLWDAYSQRKYMKIIIDHSSEKDSLVQSVTNLDGDAVNRVLCYAASVGLRNEMKQFATSDSFNDLNSFKDNIICKMFQWNECGNLLPCVYRRLDGFAASPLLEWNTPTGIIKTIILEHLQEGLAREAERSLVKSMVATGSTKPCVNKKKKKRLKKKVVTASWTRHVEDDQAEERQISDDDLHIEVILPHNTPSGLVSDSDYCDAIVTNLSPQSDKITVLIVLDDIIHDVYTRLGVQDDEFDDFTDAVTVKSRSKIPSVRKTFSEDDLEVAAADVGCKGTTIDSAINQFCGSRSRRTVRQEERSKQKRSTSLGDGSVVDRKPPMYPNKIYQPTRTQSGNGDLNWLSFDSQLFPQACHYQTSIFDGAPLCMSGSLESWNGVACQKQKDTSIFTDLLNNIDAASERDQIYLASSTAASIASSREDLEDSVHEIDDDCLLSPFNEFCADQASRASADVRSDSESPMSPTPSAPPTPPPQLSPILVSLADLGKLREEFDFPQNPVMGLKEQSRDDIRSIGEWRKSKRRDTDDHQNMGHRQVDALLSYRNVVAAQSVSRKLSSMKSFDGKQILRDDAHPNLTKSTRSIKTTRSGAKSMQNVNDTPGPDFPSLSKSRSAMPRVLHLDLACARSEGGLDGNDDASHCNVIPRARTVEHSKDGATTISSVHINPETEEFATMKEQRNSYRDMCLTLGAENAKLRNLLASKTCAPLYHPTHAPGTVSSFAYHNDQQWPAQNSFPDQFGTQATVAMSDVGIHSHPELVVRSITHHGLYGEVIPVGETFSTTSNDHFVDQSVVSEDDTCYPSVVAIGISQSSNSRQVRSGSVHSYNRRVSGGVSAYAESDISLDHNTGQDFYARPSFGLSNTFQQDSFYGGIESRLSMDINRYMKSLKSQLLKTEDRRIRAVEALTKAVKALWPRATIKQYGSHVTKLCLPSSDMDFVISLPAVHKNAPAMAPGDLEGRNAIIETNQKVLARKLKSESWLDQRSLKVIERTAVPVIKVSTKDARTGVVQLDLSFDAKEHHGLEALAMIQHILEQMPVVRPLVLVLKQFLLDRGLLTAYTGGLSSYCLFLMVARYCQEQAPTWNDSGSLLMGLLDFYGNYFDPRITGISVRTRKYFIRSQEANHVLPFTQNANRFTPLHRNFSILNSTQPQQFQSGKFDPMWVEDPLNPGNNVGRNAFRIFQVQRAFSDAHRALVASLEWDNSMHEFGNDGEYPLLKCLLQNEDVFLSIDDPIHR